MMKAKEIRKVRSYKVRDSVYVTAMKKAAKKKTSLSNLVESFVTEYSKT